MRIAGSTRAVALVVALALAASLLGCGGGKNASVAKPASQRARSSSASSAAGVSKPAASRPSTASVDLTPYAWTRYPLIAHGLGTVGRLATTNSRQAFERSYKRGYRVFEVDLALTRDGKVVARHDWSAERYARFGQTPPAGGAIPTLAQFKAMRVKAQDGRLLTPLAARDLVALLRSHPDAWLMTDIKSATVDARIRVLRELLAAAGDDANVKRRIIVQIYEEADYAPTKALGFDNLVYTFYRLRTPIDRAIEFAKAKHIRVVTIQKGKATASQVAAIRRHGLVCAAHTVNSESEAESLRDRGVRMLYSDILKP